MCVKLGSHWGYNSELNIYVVSMLRAYSLQGASQTITNKRTTNLGHATKKTKIC